MNTMQDIYSLYASFYHSAQTYAMVNKMENIDIHIIRFARLPMMSRLGFSDALWLSTLSWPHVYDGYVLNTTFV